MAFKNLTAINLFLTLMIALSSNRVEARRSRWPLPKHSRSISNSFAGRIREYKNYVNSLSSQGRKEFALDANIQLGANGVNPSKIFIKFTRPETEGLVFDALETIKSQSQLTIVKSIRVHQFKHNSAYVLRLPDGKSDKDVLAYLGAILELEGVEWVHPDYKIQAFKSPNDSDLEKQYGLNNMGGKKALLDADIDAFEAWDVATGSKSVLVGVIDTGINLNHPDLAPNIWLNPGETGLDDQGRDKATNGIDDDGNGYIDDFQGWNFIDDNNNPNDYSGHGSHVAGIIGASGNNGIGVAGVNWEVSLVPLLVLDDLGQGDLSTAMRALEYAADMGFPIVNASWGTPSYVQDFQDLLVYCRDKGVLVVAAAGNNGTNSDLTPFYPASYQVENVISVAATDNRDSLASFSNFGRQSVHLAAPGVDIYSTFSEPFGYNSLSGTSMAAPYVTGAAALIKSVWPNYNYQQIKNQILNTVDTSLDFDFSEKLITGGRLNLARAVGGVPSSLPLRLSLKSSTPKVGPPTGGTVITLTGTGFSSATKVTLGLKPCSAIEVVSQTELRCTTPPSRPLLHNIIATNPDGTTKVLTNAFLFNPVPAITSISPATISLAGGSRVTINGTDLKSGSTVKIGGKLCSDINWISEQQISCVAPSNTRGLFSVLLTNRYSQESNRSVSLSYESIPTLSSISPNFGKRSGGTTINLKGSGFVSGATIKVGSSNCQSVKWISENSMTCITAPSKTLGKVNVTVTNPFGIASTLINSYTQK